MRGSVESQFTGGATSQNAGSGVLSGRERPQSSGSVDRLRQWGPIHDRHGHLWPRL